MHFELKKNKALLFYSQILTLFFLNHKAWMRRQSLSDLASTMIALN